MKYLRQFFIILAFSFAGEVLHALIPLQVPASIYGLVLLFIALIAGWIRLPQIRETANFLIAVMPLMFIPAGVGLLESWGELKPVLLPICVIVVVSTILVMGISGTVTQAMIRKNQQKEEKQR